MFQDPYASLDPRMRVGTILREPLKVQGIGSRTEQWERVGALLREVGLSKKSIDLYPHEFSGGQRQRIGFARALTLNPRLIVADEPVSALDVSIQSQILNMMKALQQAHRLTYIVISHDLAVLKYLSDRIGVMYLGKLVEIGAAKEIYETPAHPYTRGLIDTIPVPDPVLAAAHRGRAHLRRASLSDHAALGLPVPDPLPLQRRRSARQEEPRTAVLRRRPPRGLPLPAATAGRHGGRHGLGRHTRL